MTSLHVCGTGTNARCNQIAIKVWERSFSSTLKHFDSNRKHPFWSYVMCHAHNRHATEMTKIWFQLTQMFLQSRGVWGQAVPKYHTLWNRFWGHFWTKTSYYSDKNIFPVVFHNYCAWSLGGSRYQPHSPGSCFFMFILPILSLSESRLERQRHSLVLSLLACQCGL